MSAAVQLQKNGVEMAEFQQTKLCWMSRRVFRCGICSAVSTASHRGHSVRWPWLSTGLSTARR